ncbi:hypothetical protein GCM10011502_26190 [Oceanisphaera marina]|uniref:Uncharacterized protein n=1 Tax=Oceanisphaera marina TaxID=2017550 RepID=A0ABQ1IUT5_9GAMM|nr:hypothetical protein [Oceanisphaera marina]GGB51806.1 hypothetical protein GCM10011502_26190 [Oceanisphaera marina]
MAIALVTTFYLKKRDEVTRVAGVILEKRINSEQVILSRLEDISYSVQMPEQEAKKYIALLEQTELPVPSPSLMQYAKIFGDLECFHEFQRSFEQLISSHKLWLSEKVRFHLQLMQAYLSWINSGLLISQQVPLPKGYQLSEQDQKRISSIMLTLQGVVLDMEFKGLIAELEVLMVDSIYHLNIKRPKRSLMRNGFWNRESRKLLKILGRKTLLGHARYEFFAMAFIITYQVKGLQPDEQMLAEFVSGFPERI